jgi:hypothetical protein
MTTSVFNMKVPQAMQGKFEEIVSLTDRVCEEKLNLEYAELSRAMAATLARKRPSPLTRGNAGTWAGAIVYVIGQVNFLFDKSEEVHMRADELCEIFGIAQSTCSAKSKQIRDMLGIDILEVKWTLPSNLLRNPRAWIIMIDGHAVDARGAPRHIQEEAFRLGLIPFVPKNQDSDE